ncbi:hypothetical protein MMC16_003176 [Acarospora aff. strigata]|nr:hypothetical protein [Acarospora aff. strigata]
MVVFNSITAHPLISKCIKELVYDTCEFQAKLTGGAYFDALCKQLLNQNLPSSRSKQISETADWQVNDVLEYARDRRSSVHPNQRRSERSLAEMRSYRIVDRGHRAYLEYSRQQQEWCDSGEVLARLCLGLDKLLALDTVILGSTWHGYWHDRPFDSATLCPLHMRGSPLARTWNPLFLEPGNIRIGGGGHIVFFTVIRALSICQKRVTRFKSTRILGLDQTMFDSESLMSPKLLCHTIDALSKVKSLALRRICLQDERDTGSIDAVPKILKSMTALCHLKLDFEGICANEPFPYTLSQIFGHHGVWPHLSRLQLASFTADELGLITFLRSLPALQKLRLQDVELTSGNWASAIEQMRRSLRLQEVSFDSTLRHLGGVDLYDIDDPEDIPGRMEFYVLLGGKNPLRVESLG